MENKIEKKFCACGCGNIVISKKARFIKFHSSRGENNPMFGKTRLDLSEYNKSEKAKEQRRKFGLKRKHSKETKEKISKNAIGNKWCLGRVQSKETKEKCRIGVIKYFENNPSAKENLRQKRLKQVFPVVSSLEVKLNKELNKIGLYPEIQYPLEITLIDFAFPNKKLAIYVDGCYWHSCPEHFPEKKKDNKDNYINEFLRRKGWNVIRIWEHDINKNINNVVYKIKEIVNENCINTSKP